MLLDTVFVVARAVDLVLMHQSVQKNLELRLAEVVLWLGLKYLKHVVGFSAYARAQAELEQKPEPTRPDGRGVPL
eukprot:COSAG05_NODE_9864_length_597_cov_0.586345_1_plen_75_part_00